MDESGLYMLGEFIRVMSRERRDDEGHKKRKYYVTVLCGDDVSNVGISVDEFDRFEGLGLSKGTSLMMAVEAFAFNNKIYYRATGDIHVVNGDTGEVQSPTLEKKAASGSNTGGDAVTKMEQAVRAGAR